MAQNSKIEWTDHTVNLWWGCTKVHSGCDNCYAEALSGRFGKEVWGNDEPRMRIKASFSDLMKYQRTAAKLGVTHKVFVGSMMDIFEKPMRLISGNGDGLLITTEDIRSGFFRNISDGYYPNLMFLLLTKRPSNINKYIPESWKENPPHNVMFGTSPVDVDTFKTLVPQLLQVKGKRFLSIEPQLGFIYLAERDVSGIDWIIQGGESGPNKRPFDLQWAYRMKGQCLRYKVPYFFKQIDKVQAIPHNLQIRQFPEFLEVHNETGQTKQCDQ